MQFDFENPFHRPLPEYVLQKQKMDINGHEFFCHETYYQGKLINGVELRVKQLKGLAPKSQLIDYFKQSQELVFSLSSSLLTYNTHKKIYQHLFNVEGEIIMLKTRFDRLNNRQYLIWIQKNPEEFQPVPIVSKRRARGHNQKDSKLKKKGCTVAFRKQGQDKLNSTVHKGNIEHKRGSHAVNATQFSQTGFNSSKLRQARISISNDYTINVYDFTKNEFVYESPIKIQHEKIIDIFVFFNQVKVIGFILEDTQNDRNYIYYRSFARDKKKTVEKTASFQCMLLTSKFDHMIYNEEEACYLFSENNNIFRFTAHESSKEQKGTFDSFGGHNQEIGIPVKIALKRQLQVENQILDMAINEQYVAAVTNYALFFYSAFDSTSLIFSYQLQDLEAPPLSISFNKNTLLMTHLNSTTITTFTIRNKVLKMQNSTMLELNHCKKIAKTFVNNLSGQVYCVVEFYEKEGRIQTNRILKGQSTVDLDMVPKKLDICSCYLSPASRTETKSLNLGQQKYKKLHSCAWMSKYMIETDDSLYFGNWKQTFENKRCLCIHPTGIYAVVCFKEAFKIFTLSYEGMSNTFRGDSINDIQDCAISNMGNHLAVASANTINIYDFFSCLKIKTFTLPLGVCIESVVYKSEYLCANLRSKKEYIYDIGDNYREVIGFNPKNFLNDSMKEEQFMAAALSSMNLANSSSTINAVHFDSDLKIIIFSASKHLYFFNVLTNQILFDTEMDPISCFYYCNNLKTLFLGTAKGQVISFIWPNKPQSVVREHKKIKLHSGSILSMLVSTDLRELVSIADDRSLCVSHVTYLRDMKRLQGLELIEGLSGGLSINFDFLARKGICQYTHTHMGAKMDQIKDYEDETLNMNFIMPEERAKQKDQMLGNVKDETFKLTQVNNKEYDCYKQSTDAAKQEVTKLKDAFQKFINRSKMEMKKMKEQMFKDYMRKYEASQQNEKRLKQLEEKYKKAKQKDQQLYQFQLACERDKKESEYNKLIKQYETQKENWCQERPEEIDIIDEEKKDFIQQNIESLEDMLSNFHISNSSLSCKNSNLDKEIIRLKRKMEDHRYLLERLRSNTDTLLIQKEKYDQQRIKKQQRLDKEDNVNFVDVEKQYVKQTKILIEKDKDVDVKIFMYNKEKNTLVYLEKCVQQLEHNIEQIVDNLMIEQKQGTEDEIRIGVIRKKASQIAQDKTKKNKRLTVAKNDLNNYKFHMETASDSLMADRKSNIVSCFVSNQLLDAQYAVVDDVEQNDLILQKTIQQKIMKITTDKFSWIKDGSKNKGSLENIFKQYRQLKTEAEQRTKRQSNKESLQRKSLTYRLKSSGNNVAEATTARMRIEQKKKKVLFQQKTEQKTFERIKTQQVVYENSFRKINGENQDLIESYNSLAVEFKRNKDSLKRQKLSKGSQSKKQNKIKNIELSPTPFQTYLKNKSRKLKTEPVASQILEF